MENVSNERLAALERRCRLLTLALVVIVAAAFVLAQSAPRARVVEAEKFVLRDDKGLTRAELALSDGLVVGLTMYDVLGEDRVRLTTNADGSSSLVLEGIPPDAGEGRGRCVTRVVLEAETDSALGFDVLGKRRMELKTFSLSEVMLALSDGESEKRAELWLSPDGSPHLRLRKGDGTAWTAP